MKFVKISDFAHSQAVLEKALRGGRLSNAIDRIVKAHIEATKNQNSEMLFDNRKSGEEKDVN